MVSLRVGGLAEGLMQVDWDLMSSLMTFKYLAFQARDNMVFRIESIHSGGMSRQLSLVDFRIYV